MLPRNRLPSLLVVYQLASLLLLFLTACVDGQVGARAPEKSAATIWALDAMTKVRPQMPLPSAPVTAITLYAARNEYEPFQIVIAASTRALKQVDVEATPLTDALGHRIDRQHIAIYHEHFINVGIPSNIAGQTGLWPDALIPKIDSYTGERRNGFPFDLAAQRLQPIWLDVFVPPNTPAGNYTGRVRVLEAGRELGVVDVKLVIWNFQLPATSSLPNSFGFSGSSAVEGHYGRYTNDEDILRLTQLYSKAALLHRVSLHGGSMIAPACTIAANGRVEIDWRNYDQEVAPFLDGNALPSGARFTSIDLRTNPSLTTEQQKIDYWRQWCQHFRQRGWFDRLFDYTWDEPGESNFPEICRKAALLKRADPQLATLVTKELRPQLQDAVSIWVVVINYIDDKPGNSNTAPRTSYDRELAAGRRLWWYQSCMSHGCNVVGEQYFTGWPAYIIDLPAIYSRIMPWIGWKYRIGGELYYNTVEAYSKQASSQNSPWESLYYFGGNGDGTLFYPGTPTKIGGTTHIPVESIRLKLIREGLEDYEYLLLATDLVDRKIADSVVAKLVTKTYLWEQNPVHLMQARAQLAEYIITQQQTKAGK
ncbi:MAG: glycoside hydrolase domain-containing protein [Acidobacteriota bacterium]